MVSVGEVFFSKQHSEEAFVKPWERIQDMIDGPASSSGYRAIWHSLELEGLRIPRVVVQDLLKEIDPEGVQARKAHRLKRRVYHNPRPNYAWHIDGYDKLVVSNAQYWNLEPMAHELLEGQDASVV